MFSQVFIENTGDDTYALWGANANPQVGNDGTRAGNPLKE